jgi:WD40 repeat protein
VHDDPKILSWSLDNTIRFWDAKDMSTITVMESPKDSELSCMTYLMNWGLVATGHEDGEIRVWNLEINSYVTLKWSEKNKHHNTISCIQGIIYKEAESLICGSYDGNVSIWQISKQSTKQSSMLSSSIIPTLKSVIYNYVPNKSDILGNEIHCLFFDDKSGNIIVGGNPVDINIWSMQNGEKVATLEGMHSDSVTCMAMEENFLFSGSDDMTIVMWNLITFQHVGVLKGHKDSIQDMIIFDNGLLFSCSYDRKINVWRYHTEEIIESFERNEEFRCLDCIKSYGMLLAGSNDKDILTFDIKHLLEAEPYNFDASSMGISEKYNEEDKNANEIPESDDGSLYQYKANDYDEEEEKDMDESHNKLDETDFLNKQELDDDDQLRTILQEQERIMQKDEEQRKNNS